MSPWINCSLITGPSLGEKPKLQDQAKGADTEG
jgi:hypothetical protein